MDFLKALFEQGALTWEQFEEAVNSKGYKVADLSTGNYVGKKKYEDEIGALNATIEELNGQIGKRDADIDDLQSKLTNGSKDSDTKISELTSQLTQLQNDYAQQKTDYEGKLATQNYEFAVREYANSPDNNFTSQAAKRDFINEMLSAELKMQDKKLMGADDFKKDYLTRNPDAFVVKQEPKPEPDPKPTFVKPTTPQTTPDENPFNFNFAGVREH